MRVGDLGEFGLIDLLVGKLGTRDDVIVGPGDDTAVVRTADGTELLITADTFVEDVHFIRDQVAAADVGWKSLAVSLSDVAAMGGSPRWATISIRVPGDLDADWCAEMYVGLQECAEVYDVAIVGGNVSKSLPGKISIDSSVVGVVENGRYVTRSGAQPGDVVLLTGPTGLAAAGRGCLGRGMDSALLVKAFCRPEPRVKAGMTAAASESVTAMIDISDGLAADLGHICTSSGVGAEIDADLIPVTEELLAYCEVVGEDAIVHALTGGEDYELIICCRPEHADQIEATAIGVITSGEKVTVLDVEGRPMKLDAAGWNHLQST